jgi:hypothetical protein
LTKLFFPESGDIIDVAKEAAGRLLGFCKGIEQIPGNAKKRQ